jgi:type VI secretion system protein ImpI
VLSLRIENETTLPDGGPLAITIEGTRGIDIGRDQYLDWTLPDPSRFISGKHCEVRWHDGAYWLHDVSTNGTFLEGTEGRLKGPYKLRDGDRFSIGHYIIIAHVSDEPAAPVKASGAPAQTSSTYDQLWEPVGEAAPPIDPRELKAARDLQPVKPDFLDWAVDLPRTSPSTSANSNPAHAQALPLNPRQRPDDEADWLQGSLKPAPTTPAPEIAATPTPRRPIWVTGEPNGPWAAPPASTDPSAPEDHGARESSLGEPQADSGAAFAQLIARGAGLPEDAFAGREPTELAGEIGQVIRLLTENMKQLLEARQQAKRMARSSNQTTVQALENNPLKFAPTAEEAMRIMFGPPTKSYLGAQAAITQGFDDLKTHQLKTFSAMQHALRKLMDDIDPTNVEKTSAAGRGLGDLLGSGKARYWDIYTARWHARTNNDADGMLNTFMHYFAEYYDRG